MTDTCELPRCRRPMGIIYMGALVCWHHWDLYMGERAADGELARRLGIERVPPGQGSVSRGSEHSGSGGTPTQMEIPGMPGPPERFR